MDSKFYLQKMVMIYAYFRLLLLARKQKDADSKAAEWAPSYQTWSRDKSFRSVVRIDVPSSFELPHSSAKLIKPLLGDSCSENIGFVFSSLALEKNKRYAEQGSAAVAVECLLGQSITSMLIALAQY